MESDIFISNDGKSALNITSVELTGSSYFSRATDYSLLSAGNSFQGMVSFKSTSIGAKDAALGIHLDAPGVPTYNVQVTGSDSNTATASISVSP